MKNPISKSNFRKPLKAILMLFILLIISNVFVSSVTEFFLVNREINRAGSFYKSIGTIEPLDEENYFINNAQKIISGDDLIDYEDVRRYTIGIIDGLYNPDISQHEDLYYDEDEDYKKEIGDSIFIGKIERVYQAPSAASIYEGIGLNVTVVERLAGFPDYMKEGISKGIAVSSNSLLTGEKIKFINDEVMEDLISLEEGKNYLFRTYYDSSLKEFTMIKPLYSGGPLYHKLESSESIDLENPQWNLLKEDIDVINENIKSYIVTATKDMTAMPITQEVMKSYYLKEGRFINKDDNNNQNYVCVINEDLSKLRNIQIGDKLHIKMKDTEKGSNYFTSDKDRKEWKSYETSETITFEVVGIFAFKDARRASTRGREIYIPDSSLPKEFGNYFNENENKPDIYSSNYSFTLKSSEKEEVFLEKYEKTLEDMGYKLSFIENNGEGFWSSAKSIRYSSFISLLLFTGLLLLTQYFVVHLYMEGHKLNYAIERALGISKKNASIHIIQPIILYGSIASIIGGFIGYKNAIGKAKVLLEGLSNISENNINTIGSIVYFILSIILVIVLFLAIVLLKLSKLNKSSVIDLINSYNVKKKKKEKENKISQVENVKKVEFKPMALDKIDLNKKVKNSNKITLRKYAVKHSLRSNITSLLITVLTGGFIFSLLWMNHLIIKNNDFINKAYDETRVTADIIPINDGNVVATSKGNISGTNIENILNTELVENHIALASMSYEDLFLYKNGVEEKYNIEKDNKKYHEKTPVFKIMASNEIFDVEGRFTLSELSLVDGYSLEDLNKSYKMDYTDRANPVIVDEHGNGEIPIVISRKGMEDYNLQIADKVALYTDSRGIIKTFGTIVGTFSKLDMDIVSYGFEAYSEEVPLFIYPLKALELIEKNGVYYDIVEFHFKPESNMELITRKQELMDVVNNNIYDHLKNQLKIWDDELINVVEPLEKNLSLIEILYPITFVISMIIADLMCFIVVMRRYLDTAILRILGVGAKEVETTIFIEYFTLVLVGIIISSTIIFGVSFRSYPIDLSKYIIVTVGYLLSAVLGLILGIYKITKKKPLELLQVKE